MIVDLETEIFILIFIGYYLGKKKILSKESTSQITDFVVHIVLPCSIISSFEMKLTTDILMSTIQVLLVSIGIQCIYWLLNKFLYRNWEKDEQICAKYGTMVSNASFVGMPIVQSLYGPVGLLYSSIYVLPQRFLMWSYGLSLFTSQKDNHVMKKILTHPCVAAIFVGIFVMICYNFGIYLPRGLSITLKAVGGCSTTLCFVIIGTIVSEIEFKELLNKKAVLYSIYRLFLIPFIILFITSFLPIDILSRNICVLLTSIPAATTTVILAQKYNVNSKFASQLVICSTLLSLVSIPLFTLILEIF